MSSQSEQLREEKAKLEKDLDDIRSSIESFKREPQWCGTDFLTALEEEKRVSNRLKEIDEQIKGLAIDRLF